MKFLQNSVAYSSSLSFGQIWYTTGNFLNPIFIFEYPYLKVTFAQKLLLCPFHVSEQNEEVALSGTGDRGGRCARVPVAVPRQSYRDGLEPPAASRTSAPRWDQTPNHTEWRFQITPRGITPLPHPLFHPNMGRGPISWAIPENKDMNKMKFRCFPSKTCIVDKFWHIFGHL